MNLQQFLVTFFSSSMKPWWGGEGGGGGGGELAVVTSAEKVPRQLLVPTQCSFDAAVWSYYIITVSAHNNQISSHSSR